MSDILKVSAEDLQWLKNEHSSLNCEARKLSESGPKLVILTDGHKGSKAFIDGRQVASATAKPADVVDTIGAGDSFNAGFLHALQCSGRLNKSCIGKLSKTQVHHALTYGSIVAAKTVSRVGADSPWSHEISECG